MKHDLRTRMRRSIKKFSPDSTAACRSLETYLESKPHLQTVAVFSALPGEVDLSHLVDRLPNRRWVYPLVRGDDLSFHVVRNPKDELRSGYQGISEPTPDSEMVEVTVIDAFLCPGLAFDDRGGRLGRGRGFYDRMLAHARQDALKIGVCFPFQRVADTFAEPHDIFMDLVIS